MADKVHTGGLMRCCIKSLDQDPLYGKGKEGDQVNCKWCKDVIVFKEGAWRWIGAKVESGNQG